MSAFERFPSTSPKLLIARANAVCPLKAPRLVIWPFDQMNPENIPEAFLESPATSPLELIPEASVVVPPSEPRSVIAYVAPNTGVATNGTATTARRIHRIRIGITLRMQKNYTTCPPRHSFGI